MNARTVAASVLVCAVLVVVGMQFFDLSWESALVLAPVFVVILGAIAFLVVLWAKVIRDSLAVDWRRSRIRSRESAAREDP